MDSMMNRLQKWEEEHKRAIRVGIVGAGDFGTGMVCQMAQMKGIQVSVLADMSIEKARKAFFTAGYRDDDIMIADSPASLLKGMELGKKVIVQDGNMITGSPVDVAVDVTGYPNFGARFAYDAIHTGKHVVMVNLESDVVVGPILRQMADRAGVVYTEADGDQPSLIKGLVDWAQVLGLEVVMAGKGTKVYPEEKITHGKGRISDSYMDGSKNQIEMACVANMTGFVPDVEGMHKPSIRLEEIPGVFCPKEDGGILSRKGVVDVVNCLSEDGSTLQEVYLQGGVFIVVACGNEKVANSMFSKSVFVDKSGKYALLYRPHHLVGIEAPMSILKAVLYHEATGAPMPRPVVDVSAVAKRDIKKGELLSGIGADTVKGVMTSSDAALRNGYLPYGLADEVKVNRDIPKGTFLTYDMLETRGTSFIWHLRGLQDARG